MLGGYVAWCGRTFYLRAPMPDLSSIPVAAWASATAELEKSKLRSSEAFDWGRLMELLMNPYESDPPPIQIGMAGEGWWIFRRYGSSSGFHFLRLSNGWTGVSTSRGIY
jgi:hypothetical protein